LNYPTEAKQTNKQTVNKVFINLSLVTFIVFHSWIFLFYKILSMQLTHWPMEDDSEPQHQNM